MTAKCPACGAILPPMSLICPECGYVLSSESEGSKAVRDEIKALQQLLLQAKNDQERATIISTFSTPNTKEGLMNLLVFAANQFQSSNGREDVLISSAWLGKAKQTYDLLKLQSAGDIKTLEHLQQYTKLKDEKLKVAQSEALRRRRKRIRLAAIFLGVVATIYLFLLIISNTGGEEHSQNTRQAVMELIQEGKYDEARIKAAESEYSWEQRELNEIIEQVQNKKQ